MCESVEPKKEIKVAKDVKALNNEIAAANKHLLHENGVFVIDIMGSPGSGKTTLLENLLPELSRKFRVAVIEGDLATENDAERIKKTGVTALQINTGGGCHLDASMIERELKKLDLSGLDILIIENVGNLVCPISFALGEDLRIVVLSTAEGEDKPLKYPTAMVKTDAVVISKTDIAPYVGVDAQRMKANVTAVNPQAIVLEAGKVNGVYDCSGVTEYIIAKKDER